MDFRKYDGTRDLEAARRIWRETGWLGKDREHVMDLELEGTDGFVADLNGEAECLVLTAPGRLMYQQEELPYLHVNGVTTSRVARKQHLASGVTAGAVAQGAAEGALVAALGMFDQGFYNRLGFGSGAYTNQFSLDPAHFTVTETPRVPRRLTADDWEAVHASRLARRPAHGACSLDRPALTHVPMLWGDTAFGLGYFDGPQGELTHHFWCHAKNAARGPYEVTWIVFQTREQFRELIAVLKSLGDQVRLITLREPPGIQIQDLLEHPFREYESRDKGRFELGTHAVAWWQMRMLDLPGCLARTHLPCGEVRFNLQLSDPITKYLDPQSPWQGVAGDYVVTLGAESGAEPGQDANLPSLQTTVNAFTRLWLGVRSASGLAFTDELVAPEGLLQSLDAVIRLPLPHPDWNL
ncbi:MAG: hypothetical protein ABFE16_06005 [Armatimonadia bacterium]